MRAVPSVYRIAKQFYLIPVNRNYEKIEIYHLAIEVFLRLRDYEAVRRLLRFGKAKIGKKYDRYIWECEVFSN